MALACLGDSHLVGGERAGLVRADDRRAAERLHRRQRAHDRVLARHPPRAERETRRDHRRQTLGDRRHRERHRDLEVVDRAQDERPAVRRVREVPAARKLATNHITQARTHANIFSYTHLVHAY